MAANPSHTFILAGGFITVDGHTTIDTPYEAFARFCSRVSALPCDRYLPFSGGIIGSIGFEGARALRGLAPASGFSRVPQCRLGIYETAAIFDHAEGTALIVSNGTDAAAAEKRAHELLERLRSASDCCAPRPAATGSPETRSTPAGGEFARTADAARSWIRSEQASRIHLARHLHAPATGPGALDRFLAGGEAGEMRALLSHEAAAIIATSRDALLAIRGNHIRSSMAAAAVPRSELAREMEREIAHLCADAGVQIVHEGPLGISFTGRLRHELTPIDALVALMPAPALTGSPGDRALEFISGHEEAHRALYGGAFGTIDASGLSFWTVERVQTIADGAITTTAGIDVTADTDPRALLTHLDGMFTATC